MVSYKLSVRGTAVATVVGAKHALGYTLRTNEPKLRDIRMSSIADTADEI